MHQKAFQMGHRDTILTLKLPHCLGRRFGLEICRFGASILRFLVEALKMQISAVLVQGLRLRVGAVSYRHLTLPTTP